MTLDLHSSIHAVTVYRRGAMVTRRVKLTPTDAGFPPRVQLTGLPLTLEDSSVRVEVDVQGGGGGLIAGDLQISIAVPGQQAQLAPPSNTELDAASLELSLARQHQALIEAAELRVAKLEPGARGAPQEGSAPGLSPTDARLELLAFRHQRAASLAGEGRKAVERTRIAKEQLQTLQAQEQLASASRNTRSHELRKAAVLELHLPDGPRATGPTGVVLYLHYFVPGARWAPAYTVRLDRSMRQVELELRATVGQASGEDWSGVALSLSTARPQRWTELPELEAIKIGRRQPSPAKTGWRLPPVGTDALYADYDRAFPRPRIKPPPPPPPPVPFLPSLESAPPPAPLPPGAPPPPGAVMPVASSSHGLSRSSGLGSLFERSRRVESADEGEPVAGGMVASQAPPQQPRAPAARAPAEAPELLADRDLMDYGRLHLSPAVEAHRGTLRRLDARVLYRQVSVSTLEIKGVFSQIETAAEKAEQLEAATPPSGHHWPGDEDGFDYVYSASAPVDLRCDGSFRTLSLSTSTSKARPRYISVPRETQDVFRIVTLINPLSAPLLRGPADIYIEGEYLSTSDLKTTPSKGEIELGLGVEQAIKVARNVQFTEDSSGMFKRQLELCHEIKVEIANNLSSPARVELRERVPVPARGEEDEIEVSIDRVEPPWHDYEPAESGPEADLDGGKVWRVDVAAGEKVTLEAKWTVHLSNQCELIGGNRRES